MSVLEVDGQLSEERSNPKAELIGMSMSAMNVEPSSPMVPVVVPNVDAEIEALCKHPYELNREVGNVFKTWWTANSHKLLQEELNQMRTVLKHGVLMPGRLPIIYHHPILDLNVYEDCWAGCFIFLSCTYTPEVVASSNIGKRCKIRFQSVPWIPRPTPLCLKLVRNWRPPPVGKRSTEQALVFRGKQKRHCDTQDREGNTSTVRPSLKRPRLELDKPGQRPNFVTTSRTPNIKSSPSLKTVTQANALPEASSVSALTPTKSSTGPNKTQTKANNAHDSSSEDIDTDSDSDTSSSSGSDTSSVQITNVRQVPGRSKDKGKAQVTHAIQIKTPQAATEVQNAQATDKTKEHDRLLKSQADELEKLRGEMDSMRSKIVSDTKHRSGEVNKVVVQIRNDLDKAITELKGLKGEIQKTAQDAKMRQQNLETRLKEDNKALLKEIDERMEKNYKALLRRVEDRVSNLRVT